MTSHSMATNNILTTAVARDQTSNPELVSVLLCMQLTYTFTKKIYHTPNISYETPSSHIILTQADQL